MKKKLVLLLILFLFGCESNYSGLESTFVEQFHEGVYVYSTNEVYYEGTENIELLWVNQSNSEFEHGAAFTLEILVNDSWKVVANEDDPAVFILRSFSMPFGLHLDYCDLTVFTNNLEAGNYRIIKEFSPTINSDVENSNERATYNAVTYFEVANRSVARELNYDDLLGVVQEEPISLPNDEIYDDHMDDGRLFVEGRPRGINGNYILIGDEETLKGYFWVEITEETAVEGTIFARENWTDYWRYRYKIEVADIDYSSYPYEAKAINVTVDYDDDGIISGVVSSVSSNGFSIVGFYHQALFGTLNDDATVNIDGYEGHLPDVIGVGNVIQFRVTMILEIFPGQAMVSEIVSVSEFIMPEIVIEYFNSDEVFFKGMVGQTDVKIPVFQKNSYECLSEEDTYKEFTLHCNSFDDLAIIYDREVIGFGEALELGLVHPTDFDYSMEIYFKKNFDYIVGASVVTEHNEDSFQMKISLVKDYENRYFLYTNSSDRVVTSKYSLRITYLVDDVEVHYRGIYGFVGIELDELILEEGVTYRVYYNDELISEFVA